MESRISLVELSDAITSYLGVGTACSPSSDPGRVISKFGDTRGPVLLAQVAALASEANRVDIDWEVSTLVAAGKMVRATMQERYPGLSASALDAIEWKFTFDWR